MDFTEDEGFWEMDIDGPQYQETLRCRSASSFPDTTIRERLLTGGKMLLPQSCLEQLSRMNVVYPLQFRVQLEKKNAQSAVTHLGVLEFSAPEGVAYLPDWALKSINGVDKSLITITNVSLPMGRFVKFQPQSTSFLTDLSDPRAVLEYSLRNYAAMTVGDIIYFDYAGKSYGLLVQEVKPNTDCHAILVVETDLQVDFTPPEGYIESPLSSKSTTQAGRSLASSLGKSPDVTSFSSIRGSQFSAFSGASNKLKPQAAGSVNNSLRSKTDGSNDSDEPRPLKLPSGMLFFSEKKSNQPEDKPDNAKDVFSSGKGRSLKD
jgi:ubiquitin fusion degradation protein 1